MTELAAVGVPAIYVPFPHAVDDHQTNNARFVVEAGGGWLMPQSRLTAEGLAAQLRTLDRATLLAHAERAWTLRQIHATAAVVAACDTLAKGKMS